MRTANETIDYIMAVAKRQNINQRELAKKVDMPESTLSRYANHHLEFPINYVPVFAEILGVSIADVLGIATNNTTAIELPETCRTINAVMDMGALNEATIRSPVFQTQILQAIEQDLLKLALR